MEQEPGIITPLMLAPFYKRLLNFLVDGVLICIITIEMGSLGNYVADTYQGYDYLRLGEIVPENYRISLFYSFFSVVYYGLFESYLQRTPGKYLSGTRVIRFDGAKPSEWNILLRSLLRQIPFEMISFAGPIPVGLHDTLSRTLVVDIYRYKRETLKNSKINQPNQPENEV